MKEKDIKFPRDDAERGDDGEIILMAGEAVRMRMWQERPGESARLAHSQPYEIVGYVIAGRMRLTVGDIHVELGPGDCYRVPKDASRRYEILESFESIEAVAPAA